MKAVKTRINGKIKFVILPSSSITNIGAFLEEGNNICFTLILIANVLKQYSFSSSSYSQCSAQWEYRCCNQGSRQSFDSDGKFLHNNRPVYGMQSFSCWNRTVKRIDHKSWCSLMKLSKFIIKMWFVENV